MAVIETVNFEDLFDFSPEPSEPIHNGDDTDLKSKEWNTYSSAISVKEIETENKSSSKHFKTQQLSQSLPTDWNEISLNSKSIRNLLLDFPPEFAITEGQQDFYPASGLYAAAGTEANTELIESSASTSITDNAEAQATKSKRGRKPGQKNLKTDMKSKLERSRQSARECRARKKLRYQYLDDLILEREKANLILIEELVKYQTWCHELDQGRFPEGLQQLLNEQEKVT